MSVLPELSVVVVVYDVAREAPRTLYSLSAAYQRDIAAETFEIIVVDNGSRVPVDATLLASLSGNFRLLRIDDAPVSPAYAINCGLRAARGEVVGVMIDGARIATPGLLHCALRGARLYDDAIVATLGWYLGHDFHGAAMRYGYDREREDALLDSIAWPSDGYRLFEIGTMDESSIDGWFAPIAESNAVFARRGMWERLDGVDERFDLPGGGLLNLDTFDRLLGVSGARLVIPLAEATFHQLHGGTNTNVGPDRQIENFNVWADQYAAIRGRDWTPPLGHEATFLGTLPQEPLKRIVRAATTAVGGRHQPLAVDPDFVPSESPVGRLVALGHDRFRSGHFVAAGAIARLVAVTAPHERGLDRVLSVAAPAVSRARWNSALQVERCVALGEAQAILGNTDIARDHFQEALAIDGDVVRAHLGLCRLLMPGPSYLWWLEHIYAALEPASVVEIGVFEGSSLALLRPPTIAIGVDPEARVLRPLNAETHIFAETSDSFFARGAAEPILKSNRVSIGYIDGMHVFEQALRDFIGLEAMCHEQSLILIHDTVPLDETTQSRSRQTTFWTGDVWKIVPCLKHYRPDLEIFTIATPPTGLTIVQNLDPASRVLAGAFDEAVATFGDRTLADPENELALVANDWELVSARLRSGRAPERAASDRFALGTYVVDREQQPLGPEERDIVRSFSDLYYSAWLERGADTINTSWFGYPTLKCPLDLWIYQELVVRTRPEVILETGTFRGGSALYLAMLLDVLGHGEVITIDSKARDDRPRHPRITYVTGSSTDAEIANRVVSMAGDRRAMVILDSDHSVTHVYDELNAYAKLVRPGDYLIVEDTNVNGHPSFPEHGPGPMEAVERFLSETDEFAVDRNCERFLLTLNPGGYLKRIAR